MKTIKYPRVTKLKTGKVYITVYINGKRLRVFNGLKFGIHIDPNSYEDSRRIEIAKVLAFEIHQALLQGTVPIAHSNKVTITEAPSDLESLSKALETKKQRGFSKAHSRTLEYVFHLISSQLANKQRLSLKDLKAVLEQYKNPTSYNTIRAYIINLCNEASRHGLPHDRNFNLEKKKQKEALHAVIKEVTPLLNEIKQFNSNLHLCCLLVYGCLLRPHREVRELTWGDFSEDLSYIRLSGARNKSGRNRIVPVPQYVKEILKKEEDHLNIFSGKEKPFNPDYFKGIWGRFKKRSKLLDENQTLYSFRHTGAIDVYKRTGSIEKLKAAMGHSNIMVSLTYLRGLDVAELKEEDMPNLATHARLD